MPRATTRVDRAAIAERALRIARRTAFGVLGDHATADDVAQEVAITVLRSAEKLRDPDAVDAWIHRIAVRRAIKEARRSSTRRAAEIAGHELHERTAVADDPTVGPEVDAALELLEDLPAKQRAALTLRYVHDLDDAAIATALGCRTGTVRSLLSRGRDALRATTTPARPSTAPSDQEDPRC